VQPDLMVRCTRWGWKCCTQQCVWQGVVLLAVLRLRQASAAYACSAAKAAACCSFMLHHAQLSSVRPSSHKHAVCSAWYLPQQCSHMFTCVKHAVTLHAALRDSAAFLLPS
jgi:hypothetical protein